MRTRSSSNLPVESSPNPTTSNPKRRNRRRLKQPFILEESPVDTMVDQHTMAELLRALTEGYAKEIVVPPILAEQFELKHSLINMMTSDQTINLRNEISNFQQRFDKSFHEAWDRYKDLLRACPHHGFTEFHQLDTFYNALNPVDQDSFNSVVGGNLLERRTQNVLTIIENKSKQTSAVTTAMTTILKQFQATPPPASVKAIKEIYVTCGGAHSYYQCLATGALSRNLGIIFKDTFQQSQLTTIRVIPVIVLRNMMANFFQMNTASTSGSGSLPSNTIANPKGELKAITTRSDIVLDGPSVPIPPLFVNPKEDERVEETLTDQDLAEYTIKIPPPLEKLLELANTPLNENCSAVILKKLPEKLRDPRKFLIPCGFSELKCKALADLGASINLMPLSVWKKLGLPVISTRMTLELANRAICTPAGIARDVFVSVGKFTFHANFVIVDYESDHRVPLILGRPFLRIARALIDIHKEEMILRDGDERLTLNMRHDTSSYSNQPQKESINMINIYDDSSEDFLEDLFATNHQSDHLLEEFADELAFITFPLGNDDLPFDIEFNLKEIEYLLNNDPIKEMDSILEDSVDEDNLANLNDNLADTIPEMFTDEHALDYSPLSLYDEYDDNLFKVESNTEYVYDDPFDSKGEKIKESKLLIDELDLLRLSDFLSFSDYDSFLFKDFFEVDDLPSTNNEDKVFNPRIYIRENLFEVITHVAPDKNVKKLAISHASLILEDFDPPLYELSFFKEVPDAETLLSFSFENEEKVFKPEILTSKGVHSCLIPELSHQGYKIFKIIKSLMEIFFSHGEDIRILDVPCLHFYFP
nr:reverse transcriptase domain-containing protein [Tanacetum cinerariifolium]